MKRNRVLLAALAVLFSAPSDAETGQSAAAYAPDGSLALPDYRTWIFLSSGIDMSYSERPAMSDGSMFDNVFVDPAAWRSFLETGTWPDHTVLVTENRGAQSKASINRRGEFQAGGLMGLEFHVKDTARFPGGWAFFASDGKAPASLIPASAACYSCHRQHAAVDTTFVQFYPTLLPIARSRGTLSPEYQKEAAAETR
jgi:hypothetical protein